MRIDNIFAVSILTMGVSSWFTLPNLWPWNYSSKLPPGWNPVNGLPPCGPDGPAQTPPLDALSSSSEPSPEGAITTTEPSPSGLADAFGLMDLSPSPLSQVATASAQISSQAQQVVAVTSILAESVLPINPASSQILQPALTIAEVANLASSQAQEVVPVASTIGGDISPPSSQGQDVIPAASIEAEAINPITSSQAQKLNPAISTGAEAINPVASSQAHVIISAMSTVVDGIGPGSSQAQNILPTASTFAEMLSPQGSSLAQEAVASALGPELVISPSASLVPGVIPSITIAVAEVESLIPPSALDEALSTQEAIASEVPQTSLDPLTPQGQANIAPTFNSSETTADQTVAISQETTQAVYSKGNITQPTPNYQNQTILAPNATAASNSSSHHATLKSVGSTDTPKSLVRTHELRS